MNKSFLKKIFIFTLLLHFFWSNSFSNEQTLSLSQASNKNQSLPNEQKLVTFLSFPEIPNLNHKDFLYVQYSEDLQQYYIDFAAQNKTNISFYSYKVKEDDSLFSIAARCNIPYDTIATLNNIESADEKLTNKTLILPTCAGLFIFDSTRNLTNKNSSTFESLLQKKYAEKLDELKYICYNINNKYYIHIPEERIDQTTRAFFLDVKLKPPLDHYWLSSDYGYRQSPFGGKKQFHKGIDMAAPEGTSVYACKSGKIISTVKLDKTFGNYIVIKHSNGLSSIYAHLSKINVKMGELVSTGQEIGKVGKTGQVTGAHLHFEIRQNGQPTNPNSYIKR